MYWRPLLSLLVRRREIVHSEIRFPHPSLHTRRRRALYNTSGPNNFSRIAPFLWFDSNAEEAVDFYLTVFNNARCLDELCTTDDSRGPKGSILRRPDVYAAQTAYARVRRDPSRTTSSAIQPRLGRF
jgi:3-demethylubiquinone-9 3-methyltransferase